MEQRLWVWPTVRAGIGYRLDNLRIAIGWLAELVASPDGIAAMFTVDPISAQAAQREGEAVAAALWADWAAGRLRAEVDCAELDALDRTRRQLTSRAASLLAQAGAGDAAALLAQLAVDLAAVADGGEPC